jgi:hypothetical protein
VPLNGIKNAFNSVKNAATDMRNWVAARWQDFVNDVHAMPGKISAAASGMFNGITNAFKSAINDLIRGWNRLQFTIPGVDTHIPGVGKIGGFTLGTPDIPYLAAGGVINRAGLAVVGERGPELVGLPTGAQVYRNGTTPANAAGITLNGNLTVNLKGVLDPSDPVAFHRMISNIRDELRALERSYM